jgi:hypothetical protein
VESRENLASTVQISSNPRHSKTRGLEPYHPRQHFRERLHWQVGGEPGEPGKYSLDIPEPTALKDPGARAVSPAAALPGTPALAPRTTKSCSKLPMLSPSRGPASATSTPVVPYGVPPTPGTSVADTTTGRRRAIGTDEARLLSPRHHFLKPRAKTGEAGAA